jgi:hypothetical protein
MRGVFVQWIFLSRRNISGYGSTYRSMNAATNCDTVEKYNFTAAKDINLERQKDIIMLQVISLSNFKMSKKKVSSRKIALSKY